MNELNNKGCGAIIIRQGNEEYDQLNPLHVRSKSKEKRRREGS